MPSIQSLKKELRGIRSTQKLTRAMRTVSAAKFSKLNAAFGQYAEYGRQCKACFDAYQDSFLDAVGAPDPSAPPVFLVMSSNKGLCGSFNAELLKFAEETLDGRSGFLLVACGKKAIRYFKGRNVPLAGEWVLADVPTFEESGALLESVLALRRDGRASGVYVIYPAYVNMLEQTPAVCELFPPAKAEKDREEDRTALFVPDRRAMIEETADTVFGSMFYELVLEAALGAQAATLMTMRAAYDAATEFCERLEGEINRKRQSTVTADVIETSSGEAFKQGQV